MTTYQVYEYQTLTDLAVQLYGDAQLVVKLCLDNNLTLDDELTGAFTLVYDETLTALSDPASYLNVTDQFVATYSQDDNGGMLEHSSQEHTQEEHN
jgi:hypothetical protein